MNERKKIDNFFQESYQNYEVTPPDFIWPQIEEKLQKKKKRRLVPVWWWSTGVAALLVIGLLFFNSNYKIVPKNTGTTPTVVEVNTNTIESDENGKEAVEKPFDSSKEIPSLKKESPKADGIATAPNSAGNSNKSTTPNSAVVASKTLPATNGFPSSSSNHKSDLQSDSNFARTDGVVSSGLQQTSVAPSELKGDSLPSAVALQETTTSKTDAVVTTTTATEKNNSVFSTNEINKINPSTLNDSTKAIALTEKNELEELLTKNEKEVTKELQKNRWQITPNLAPIYFGSFADGSPLDSNLDNNSKTYNTSLSYGVLASYAINDKVKVRAGINNVSVDYSTSDIVFFQTANARMMRNIDPTVQGSLIEIIPIKNLNTDSFNRMESEQNTGILNQQMGYFEIPLEVSYTLMNKKFGVELLGGFSSLILNRNEVFLSNDDMTMKIGEATNLNNFHISTNFGVGLTYRFLKQFQANIEPMFKYQINTFSRDAENFRPYIFGIYSGISYRF